MSKLYPLSKYFQAVSDLAAHHEYSAHMFEGDDEYVKGFRIIERGTGNILAMWPISLRDNSRGVKVIESTEYLFLPARNIPNASQGEFDAIIEMLP